MVKYTMSYMVVHSVCLFILMLVCICGKERLAWLFEKTH
jgi:hypothetical protein